MSGANFTLESAKRIVAAVKKVESLPTNLAGIPNPGQAIGTSFWAGLTGCDSTGLYWDWVAVVPSANLRAASSPWSFSETSIWSFRQPYTAGFANAVEANSRRMIDPGTVVLLTFIGYANPATNVIAGTQGTVTNVGGSPPVDPSPGSLLAFMDPVEPLGQSDETSDPTPVPMYLFNYNVRDNAAALPVHDHRDAYHGGYAFACYHPGTALVQQPFGI